VEYNYFFVKEGTSKEDAVTAIELPSCYHNLKHSLIDNSFDCCTNLSQYIFSNSKVESTLYCKITKAEALVTIVLAPSGVTDFLVTL
jgi:hypothetical protein